jgi:hypothetical protein
MRCLLSLAIRHSRLRCSVRIERRAKRNQREQEKYSGPAAANDMTANFAFRFHNFRGGDPRCSTELAGQSSRKILRKFEIDRFWGSLIFWGLAKQSSQKACQLCLATGPCQYYFLRKSKKNVSGTISPSECPACFVKLDYAFNCSARIQNANLTGAKARAALCVADCAS